MPGPITSRSVVVTGDSPLADELLDGLDDLGDRRGAVGVHVRVGGVGARRGGRGRRPAARHRPGRPHLVGARRGHAAHVRRPHRRRVGRRLRAQPRRRVVARPRQRGTAAAAARVRWCSSCPRSAWPAPPSSRCSPRSPRACGCWRRGADASGASTARPSTPSPLHPHHWVDADAADALTRGISLVDARVRWPRERGRRPRTADRPARRPRRALPHRGDAGRRRRHLGGAVTRRRRCRRPDCSTARPSSSPAPAAASAGASRSPARPTAPTS